MADQHQNHSATTGGNTMQKVPVTAAPGRGEHPDIHGPKNGGIHHFMPPPMQTITGKRMTPGGFSYEHPREQTGATSAAGRDIHTADQYGAASFVPPSIHMITGESVMPMESPGLPLSPAPDEAPESVANPYYAAGFLRNYIGREMRVEFLIGASGALMDRMGTLIEVGASYIVLKPTQTDDLLMCDLYSVKFVTIYR